MSAFRGIFLAAIAGIIMWILISWALWIVFFKDLPPAFSHPPMTLREKKMVHKALKRHGEFPITREGIEGVFYMTRGEERIRL
jgi:hypothetical protein